MSRLNMSLPVSYEILTPCENFLSEVSCSTFLYDGDFHSDANEQEVVISISGINLSN
jgi:hypothetical protein